MKNPLVFGVGIEEERRDHIANILGVQVVAKLDKYLGMPSVVGQSKQQIFSVIRERIWKIINGWGEKTLSRARNEVLLKAVLQAIPCYIMSCFLLPVYLIDAIEAAIRAIWRGDGDKKKMHGWLV